jgi:hypothetical protein
MNYIHQLKADLDSARREIAALRSGLNDLHSYLHSPKFYCGDRLDGYVHVTDVLARMNATSSDAIVAREEATTK